MENCWYAMRVTYRRELLAKEELEGAGFRVFIPMVVEAREDPRTHKMKRVEVPAIHNLLFVYADPTELQLFKKDREYLQYICTKAHTEVSRKIIIPDYQMDAFMQLYNNTDSKILAPENLLPGTPVRIIAGPFAGLTGTYQRVVGHRNRFFVISLNGLISIGNTLIRPHMVQEISG
ncbi:MAG: UpxY family transcription antiterminator [Bacteroidaceae bacterium]|nr:UpxY family transcription antiterminator [Bacteroidaceae bacterium]